MVGYTSLALNLSNSSNLEQLALNRFNTYPVFRICQTIFRFMGDRDNGDDYCGGTNALARSAVFFLIT